jgi:hypothetical protein
LLTIIRFWGIFWVDASSNKAAEESFLKIARVCKLEEDFEATKRWLANIEDQWLLVIDNADDPSIDISRFFPNGDRCTILVTTRNHECKIHATVGSIEFGAMGVEEATTLLHRATDLEDTPDKEFRSLAKPIVQTLGCHALAIVQAGAYIRQGGCSMEEYHGVYSRHRKQLLSRESKQARIDYKYTVYTTWEISVNLIEKMSTESANDAIELLQLFSFMHFDGITEDILKETWKSMRNQEPSEWTRMHQLRVLYEDTSLDWDPYMIREALILLSSLSLLTFDRINGISIHPLVHAWARDRLTKTDQKRWWMIAASTLAMPISLDALSFHYSFRISLLPHIDSCLKSHNELFAKGDADSERLDMAAKFARVY